MGQWLWLIELMPERFRLIHGYLSLIFAIQDEIKRMCMNNPPCGGYADGCPHNITLGCPLFSIHDINLNKITVQIPIIRKYSNVTSDQDCYISKSA